VHELAIMESVVDQVAERLGRREDHHQRRASRSANGLDVVALSGRVFQNTLLLSRTVSILERDGFRVLTHLRVPTNDGGISFGQAAVAAARDGARD
jgi:hydrogenase maturation factor HypF (carbamoyltransferase family)